MNKPFLKWLKVFLAIAFATGFLIWADLETVIRQVKFIEPSFFAHIISIQFLTIFFQSLRLYSLAPKLFKSKTIVAKLSFVSQFFSNFLPAGVGGDLYKVLWIRDKSSTSMALSVVAVDRLTGLIFVALFGTISTLITTRYLPDIELTNSKWIYLFPFLFCMAVLTYKIHVVRNAIDSLFHSLRTVAATIGAKQAIVFLGFSTIVFILRVLRFLLLLQYFSPEISLLDALIVLFFIQIVMMLPVSFGGVGLVEFSLVLILDIFGIFSDDAILIALLNRVSIWLVSVPGLIIWLTDMRKKVNT